MRNLCLLLLIIYLVDCEAKRHGYEYGRSGQSGHRSIGSSSGGWRNRKDHLKWRISGNRRDSSDSDSDSDSKESDLLNRNTPRKPWVTNTTPRKPWVTSTSWTSNTPRKPWVTSTSWTSNTPRKPWVTSTSWTSPDFSNSWTTKGPSHSWTTDNAVRSTRSDVEVTDCSDVQDFNPRAESGVYRIALDPLSVYCEMNVAPGGWTVIQRRKNGQVDFYRTWEEYEQGFGYVSGEYWIGNKNLAVFTNIRPYTLRIEMVDAKGIKHYAEYSRFVVAGAAFKYKLLSVGRYSGTAGDSLSYHVGQPFSTFDQDNDAVPENSCAKNSHGAWWYKFCHESNLNGEFGKSITWRTLTGYSNSLKSVVMMIRPTKVSH